jgi:hypothetical protein
VVKGDITREGNTIMEKLRIAERFITTLLPSQKSKRKYPTNELVEIHYKINYLFKKLFDFKLDIQELERIMDENYERMEVIMTDKSFKDDNYKYLDRQVQAKEGDPEIYKLRKKDYES